MKILWLSRHSPNNKQVEELEQKFGDVDLFHVSTTINHPNEVKQLMEEFKCDEIVTVIPLSIIAKLTGMGIRPIRAIMSRELDNKNVPVFKHERFERIKNVVVVSEPL